MTGKPKISLLLIVLIFALISFSCRVNRSVPTAGRSLANIYNPSRSSIHPAFSVYHVNDSSTVVYLRIIPSELLFNQANEQGEYIAELGVQYYLFEAGQNNSFRSVADSASMDKLIKRDNVRNSYFTALPLRVGAPGYYLLRVDLTDKLRDNTSRSYLVIDKRSPYSSQNFRVLSANTNYPVFTDVFKGSQDFRLRFNRMGFDSIYVDYYNMDRTLPRPVFSTAPEIPMQAFPDSSWVLPYADSSAYSLGEKGIYKFRMNPERDEGVKLYNFGDEYPMVKSPDALLGPLVYLTSSAEFRDLRMEPNRKLAVDNFWLGLTSDMDDARELIRVYYNRVLFSNLFFSSYKEGWKTDRGMIYIVFGPPDLLEANPDGEKWTYISGKSGGPVEFVFKRRENKFSDFHYELDRRMSSTGLWSNAVSSWRKGKIYSPEL